jgi:hypothetical protein
MPPIPISAKIAIFLSSTTTRSNLVHRMLYTVVLDADSSSL